MVLGFELGLVLVKQALSLEPLCRFSVSSLWKANFCHLRVRSIELRCHGSGIINPLHLDLLQLHVVCLHWLNVLIEARMSPGDPDNHGN
jgi:hypothetical protein